MVRVIASAAAVSARTGRSTLQGWLLAVDPVLQQGCLSADRIYQQSETPARGKTPSPDLLADARFDHRAATTPTIASCNPAHIASRRK
jgi:hypothetical protein